MGPEGMRGPGMEEGSSGGKVIGLLKSKGFTVFLFLIILAEALCIFRIKRKRANEEFFDE